MFSTPADLGIVAYGMVEPNGLTPYLNSVVQVNHVSTDVYEIILPGDPSQQEILQEGQSQVPQRDIVIITPYVGPLNYYVYPQSPPSKFVRRVLFFTNSNVPQDASFAFLILRSLISPPQDDQGNYIAPA